MKPASASMRKRSNPFAILVRVLVMTAAFGVLGLSIGGLMGILAISIMNLAGQHIDMNMALFAGGMPGAVIGLVLGLAVIGQLGTEATPPRRGMIFFRLRR